jgi:hypothetical protein
MRDEEVPLMRGGGGGRRCVIVAADAGSVLLWRGSLEIWRRLYVSKS